ncbi:NAD(P)/FAD-dependent oxidoreductase [Lentzea sp. PSKA42]|uniref:NAD(P)/FAD-dependent oxidoreductase n=1 Tax=Lentzea indica TaxID=2604800 RepID=A0ABX1FJ96_9PSEU|nr:NAD(P)/FAD-dependent oxidoreductase [Lentzea indica]NKE58995.1 NAD(P)/FAD-dependent oxidoreductase [Lentzea indica]
MIEHRDVIIVGAGLSGIGAACHFRRKFPARSLAILEGRAAIGGTWDLFRYPGVRSDSDMFTLGYSFRPWEGAEAIADGPSILRYIEDTAREFAIAGDIRLNHRVTTAAWDSETALWTVTARRTDVGEDVILTARFLWVCTGYYRYDEGFTPQFPGAEDFEGRIVHPQHWPEDLDHAGKRVVVIGSGATAVTLVPSMATTAGHVTMLQRSPSYIAAAPRRDRLADLLHRALPKSLAHNAIRWRNVVLDLAMFQLSRRRPSLVKALMRRETAKRLPAGYDVAKHFTPNYNPWDQRVCLAPDGDLFAAIRDGKASVVTDVVDTFTPDGIRLKSGDEIAADIVVTATGLNMLALGEMEVSVDGSSIDIGSTVSYKGMMLSGVPNLFLTLGYTNASWTLKADLISRYACRLIDHMDSNHHSSVTPLPPADGELAPLMDLTSGYVRRGIDQFPKQGIVASWRQHQNYLRDLRLFTRGPLDDHVLFASVAIGQRPSVGRSSKTLR